MSDKACSQAAHPLCTVIAFVLIGIQVHQWCFFINSIVLCLGIIDSRAYIIQVGNVLLISIATYIFQTALLIVRCIGRGVEVGIAAFYIIECNIAVRLAIFFTDTKDNAPCICCSLLIVIGFWIVDTDGGAIDADMVTQVITVRGISVYIEAAAAAVGRIAKDDILIKADSNIRAIV